MSELKLCCWTADFKEQAWSTGCGDFWYSDFREVEDGSMSIDPRDEGYKHCPFCGGIIEVKP